MGQTWLLRKKIPGHLPIRQDFQSRLAQFAGIIHTVHHHEALKCLLPDLFCLAGLDAFSQLEQGWRRFKRQVPNSRGFVERSLRELEIAIGQ